MVYSGGRYVNYRYNAEGSLAELDYGEGNAAPTATYRFEYDSLGRLIRSQQRDGNTVTQRTEQLYDTANRLSAQGWTIGGTSYRESYAYDASDGSLTTLNTAVGTKIGYNYDALKRLRSRAVYQGSTPLFENRYALQDPDGKDSFGVSIGFSFWIFGWGFSVSAGIVGTDDDIGLQFSVARSDTFDTSSQMGVSIGPSVSVQVTDRTVTSGLDGPSTAVGGGKDLGFDALFDENNDYMGWQLNAGLDSGIIVPSADIHKITSKTYTVHVMPTINLPKRAKDWVYRDEKQ